MENKLIIKSEIQRESFIVPLNKEKRNSTLSASWRQMMGGRLAIIDEDYEKMVRTIKFVPCDLQGHELKDKYWCSFCGNIYAQHPQIPTPNGPFPCSVPCEREWQDGIEVIYLNEVIVESIKCCGHFTHHFTEDK